ncbi:aquaporin-like protein [Kockiozyma suomiensis]|uniref:aquaporin-like protein n=1 Tax=Kockiozyma suomiensis TaxID=1337062 RepID=UPI0033440E45
MASSSDDFTISTSSGPSSEETTIPRSLPPKAGRSHAHNEFLRREDIRGEDVEILEQEERLNGVQISSYRRIRRKLREPLAEFLGCVVFIVFGDGSVAQKVLSNEAAGNEMSVNFSFGVGVMIGFLVSVAGGAAGHLNPAITLANCIFRKFPWKKLPMYFLAQFLGCGFGAAIVFGTYRTSITHFDGGTRAVTGATSTAGIYNTYPQEFLDEAAQIMSEFSASIILAICVNAIAVQSSPRRDPHLPVEWNLVRGMSLFLAIYVIGASLGWQTGYAINPARDFGPRMVAYMAGYGREVFWAYNNYSWIPVVMPFLGAIAGQGIFDFMVIENDEESFVTSPSIAITKLKKTLRGEPLVQSDIEKTQK